MLRKRKELLFRELCTRLPYAVKIERVNSFYKWKKEIEDFSDFFLAYESIELLKSSIEHLEVKPYLRPMSSMTEEEIEDLKRRYVFCESCRDENDVMDVVNRCKIEFCDAANVLSWLNEHHFDYSGLIKKGLALEAPEGMYEFNSEKNNMSDMGMTTNEEKAKELTQKTSPEVPVKSAVFASSMDMAEWKDSQYAEEKKELVGLVNMLPINENNQTIIEDLKSMLS